jgi:hypothetical protein
MSEERAKDSTAGIDHSSASRKRDAARDAKCVSASHTILFERPEERCNVCSEPLMPEDDDDPSSVRGSGLLVWARGEERRYEEPQLCPSCAAAIGVSALQRWEIEEDEG